MENMENLVAEQVTENVEQTTEESPKLYTEEEITSVAIDDIHAIADDWSCYPLELKKEQFIDYKLLLKD